ncbi:26S proteasome regulatory subunit, C-terminal [Artemisia annua]|uniref:26S proteasome regulatory subunit, C-terminal n=1 Tax=Artemisia annua TaxID=35608 RepID=A0A2U1LNK4_ARTAN|nr:26S proteasome regulatory subunit, C-terminal [Artemisia annua]
MSIFPRCDESEHFLFKKRWDKPKQISALFVAVVILICIYVIAKVAEMWQIIKVWCFDKWEFMSWLGYADLNNFTIANFSYCFIVIQYEHGALLSIRKLQHLTEKFTSVGPISADSIGCACARMMEIAGLIESGTYAHEVSRISRPVRLTIALRRKLKAYVVSLFLSFAVTPGSDTHPRLVAYLPKVDGG